MRRALPVFAVVALAVTAGCLGGGTAPAAMGTTTAPPTTTQTVTETPSEMPTTTATSERQRTTKEYPYGTEFVSVDPLQNQSRGNVSKAGFVAFETLTEREQTVFRQALEEGRQTFRPDGERTNPFGFNDENRPQFVRYEGTWYHVQVAIV